MIYFNDFWLLRDYHVALNSTVTAVNITLHLGRTNHLFFTFLQQFEQSFAFQEQLGASGEGDADEVKRIFLEGNPYLLVLTMCVSMLHSVFDFLAFKNDIGFWQKNKSMEGLSARTIFYNCFSQFIILLYLMDNDTSWIILISSVVGFGIECWKITKAMKVSRTTWRGLPCLKFEDRGSYIKSKTAEYDRIAYK